MRSECSVFAEYAGMVMLMKNIFEKDIKNGENKAKRFLKAAEKQKDSMSKYKEKCQDNDIFKSE